MSTNITVLSGRLTKAPVLRLTDEEVPVCTFTLAAQRPYVSKVTGKREADFFPVVVWQRTAESCNKYLYKGGRVAVIGSLKNHRYTTDDGTERIVTELVASSVDFIDFKDDSKESQESPMEKLGQAEALNDDDIPF